MNDSVATPIQIEVLGMFCWQAAAADLGMSMLEASFWVGPQTLQLPGGKDLEQQA